MGFKVNPWCSDTPCPRTPSPKLGPHTLRSLVTFTVTNPCQGAEAVVPALPTSTHQKLRVSIFLLQHGFSGLSDAFSRRKNREGLTNPPLFIHITLLLLKINPECNTVKSLFLSQTCDGASGQVTGTQALSLLWLCPPPSPGCFFSPELLKSCEQHIDGGIEGGRDPF